MPTTSSAIAQPSARRIHDEGRATTTTAASTREHVVARGENLTSIAEDHGTTVAALLRENPAVRGNPDHLRVGQRLRLPEPPAPPTPSRTAADDETVARSRSRALGAESIARARVAPLGELARGASGEPVRALQEQLNAAGSARPALVVDGDFGRRTEAAVKRYQSSRGLSPSGVVDRATQTALAERRPAIEEPLAMGAFGPPVRELQKDLNRHGGGLTVDGDFGAATDRAVRAFQRANRLEDTGVVDAATRSALDSESAARIPEEARAPTARTATGYRNGVAFSLELVGIGNGEALGREAAESFARMKQAAAQDGVHLNVVSGFRTNDEQRALYRAYQRGRGNLAAPPGYSNHQNGIAVDITTGGSRQSASYRWLAENGARFGFHNTVASEPWHWEYLR